MNFVIIFQPNHVNAWQFWEGNFFFFYISLEPMSLDNLKPPECCQQTGWMAQLNTMKVNKDKCKLLCWTVIILYIQSKKGNQLDLGWGKDEEVLTSGNWAQLGKEPTLLWCIRGPAIEGRRRGVTFLHMETFSCDIRRPRMNTGLEEERNDFRRRSEVKPQCLIEELPAFVTA